MRIQSRHDVQRVEHTVLIPITLSPGRWLSGCVLVCQDDLYQVMLIKPSVSIGVAGARQCLEADFSGMVKLTKIPTSGR